MPRTAGLSADGPQILAAASNGPDGHFEAGAIRSASRILVALNTGNDYSCPLRVTLGY